MKKIKAKGLADGIEVWCQHERLVPIDELKPNPRNPNTHPAKQIELLAKNIQHFGWRHPVTVSRRSGLIVSGHGRIQAAQLLGLKLVPVDFQDYRTDDEELAILVADNRLAELSAIDVNVLEGIASQWSENSFDVGLAGFDAADLDALLQVTAPGESVGAGDASEGDEPPLQPEANVTVAIGLYRFLVPQADYLRWVDVLKQSCEFSKEAVLAELRRRLEL